MKNVYDLALEDTHLDKVTSREYAGPCPRCKGTDRFHVQPDRRTGGAWMCRNCWDATDKGWGDAIEYLRQMRNMSFQDAKDFLTDSVDGARDRIDTAHKKRTYDAPGLEWQEQKWTFINDAYECLWSAEGVQARKYLYKRGLKETTIDGAYLGYTPAHAVPLKNNGGYRSIPAIVIPWYAHGQLWRVNLRNLHNPLPDDESKYYNLYGGSNSGLYYGDTLDYSRYTFIVEGELDALSLMQEVHSFANVVATGSTDGSRTPLWQEKLACMPYVFVAYDNEGIGDNASRYWLAKLPESTRYRPLAHDVNDMLVQGYNVEQWAEDAIDWHRDTILAPYWAACVEADRRKEEQDEANTTTPVYVPVSLPDVPRASCPFHVIQVTGNEQRIRTVPCRKKPTKNGWCEEHQHSHLFLDMGAALDYPRVEIHESRVIGRGVENWEDHATHATLKHDLPRIKAMLDMKQSA